MRMLKMLLLVLAGILVLAVLAVLSLPLWFDPNDYKDQVTGAVKQHTGRDLILEDALQLAMFPKLALETGKVRFGNAEGFSSADFARMENARIGLKVMPLLDNKVEMDTIYVEGAEIFLERRADGRANWDDLAAAKPDDDASPQEPQGPGELPAIHINGITLKNVTLDWHDATREQRYRVSGLDLESGAVALGQPLDLKLNFDLAAEGPQQLQSRVEMRGRFLADPEQQRFSLEALALQADTRSPLLPGGKQDLALTLEQVEVDAAKMDVTLGEAVLKLAGTTSRAAFQGNALLTAPQFKGTLQLDAPDLRQSLQSLQVALPPSVPENLLHKAKVDLAFNGNLSPPLPEGEGSDRIGEAGVVVENLVVEVDDNRLDVPRLEYDLTQQKVALPRLQLFFSNLLLEISGNAQNVAAAPDFQFDVAAEPFDLRALLADLNIALPPGADPETLRKVALNLEVDGKPEGLFLPKIDLTVDETQVQGHADLQNPGTLTLNLELTADALNLDRYLPPPPDKPEPPPASDTPPGDDPLPLEILHTLDLNGSLTIQTLQVAKLTGEDIKLRVTTKQGKLQFDTDARLYQGDLRLHHEFDAAASPPRLKLHKQLSRVQAGPLLDDLQDGRGALVGTAEFRADLEADARSARTIQETLRGDLGFAFLDGAYKGVDLGAKLRQAQAVLKGEPIPSDDGPQQTDFTELTGKVHIQDGQALLQHLEMKAPLLRVDGGGSIGLLDQVLNLQLNASVVGTATGQGGKELEDLYGLTIPVTLRGTTAKPELGIDIKQLAELSARSKIGEKLKKQEEKVQRKLQEKLGEDLGGKAADVLKGFFN